MSHIIYAHATREPEAEQADADGKPAEFIVVNKLTVRRTRHDPTAEARRNSGGKIARATRQAHERAAPPRRHRQRHNRLAGNESSAGENKKQSAKHERG